MSDEKDTVKLIEWAEKRLKGTSRNPFASVRDAIEEGFDTGTSEYDGSDPDINLLQDAKLLIERLVDALKNAWDFIATDDVSDEATIVAELGERRKEKCGITFLDGDTYVVYAGDLLEVYAKSAAYSGL